MAASLRAVWYSVQYKPLIPHWSLWILLVTWASILWAYSAGPSTGLLTHSPCSCVNPSSLPFLEKSLSLLLVGSAFKKTASLHYQILYLIAFTQQLRTHILCKASIAAHCGQCPLTVLWTQMLDFVSMQKHIVDSVVLLRPTFYSALWIFFHSLKHWSYFL